MGDGATGDNLAPAAVTGVSTATQVSAGTSHTCARLSDSTITCWGLGTSGQLGDGNGTSSSSAVAVSGISTANEVGAGGNTSCARLADSTIECWGSDSSGQLGDGGAIPGTDSNTSVAVSGISTASELGGGGSSHHCALLSTGVISCWGENGSRQLGNGNTTDQSSPVSVTDL